MAALTLDIAQELMSEELIEEMEFTDEEVYFTLWKIVHWRTNDIITGETASDLHNFVDYMVESEVFTEALGADLEKMLDDTNWICSVDSMQTEIGKQALALRDSSFAFWDNTLVGVTGDYNKQIALGDAAFGTALGIVGGLGGGPAVGAFTGSFGAALASIGLTEAFMAIDAFLESNQACSCSACMNWGPPGSPVPFP